MGVVTFAITWSFFFTTPGVVKWSLSTDPIAWNVTGEVLFKDIVLLCVCAVLFLASLPQSVVQSPTAQNFHHPATAFAGLAPSLSEAGSNICWAGVYLGVRPLL